MASIWGQGLDLFLGSLVYPQALVELAWKVARCAVVDVETTRIERMRIGEKAEHGEKVAVELLVSQKLEKVKT